MKTLIIAAATVIGLGTAAYAGTDANQTPNIYAQQQPGAVAQQEPGYIETQPTNPGSVSAYVTEGSHGTWLFPPNMYEGNNN